MPLGFLLLLAAGLCQGSFGLGYKKYSPFSWAAFWGIYNILCIITSVAFTWMVAPKLWQVMGDLGPSCFVIPALCGALWGLSAVGFSKAISLVGMSMVYGISMGISTIVGSVMPMILENRIPSGKSFVFFLIGLLLTLLGVAVITYAGIKRDGGAKGSALGMILSVLSGLGSGAMNVGFTYAESISLEFEKLGYSQAAVSGGKWLPVLVGGCLFGALFCAIELSTKKEWHTIKMPGAFRRTGILFGVSIIWYAALLLYGLATVLLGESGSSIGWILFNSLALVISVLWGLTSGEWKDKKKTALFTGCFVLISAWIFTALV